jgi:hypothetical protein
MNLILQLTMTDTRVYDPPRLLFGFKYGENSKPGFILLDDSYDERNSSTDHDGYTSLRHT